MLFCGETILTVFVEILAFAAICERKHLASPAWRHSHANPVQLRTNALAPNISDLAGTVSKLILGHSGHGGGVHRDAPGHHHVVEADNKC